MTPNLPENIQLSNQATVECLVHPSDCLTVWLTAAAQYHKRSYISLAWEMVGAQNSKCTFY